MPARAALVMGGCTVSSVCYAMTIRAALGLGPLFVVQDGLSIQIGVSIGTAVTITGLGLVAVALALRAWPGPATIAVPFLSGAILNASLPAVPVFHGLALRLGLVALASCLMALGGAMIIRAASGVAAYDLVMLGICKLTRRKVSWVRLAMELTMLVCGWLLGGAVGIGTVITGVLVGPSMQFWLRRVGALGADELPATAG